MATLAELISMKLILSVDCCHWIEPVFPVSIVFPALFEQINTTLAPVVALP